MRSQSKAILEVGKLRDFEDFRYEWAACINDSLIESLSQYKACSLSVSKINSKA